MIIVYLWAACRPASVWALLVPGRSWTRLFGYSARGCLFEPADWNWDRPVSPWGCMRLPGFQRVALICRACECRSGLIFEAILSGCLWTCRLRRLFLRNIPFLRESRGLLLIFCVILLGDVSFVRVRSFPVRLATVFPPRLARTGWKDLVF